MITVTPGQRLHCERCGHDWNARSERAPVQCPRCKSTRWGAQGGGENYRPGGRPKFVDFEKLASFGIWRDRTETDEELLRELGSGFTGPEED